MNCRKQEIRFNLYDATDDKIKLFATIKTNDYHKLIRRTKEALKISDDAQIKFYAAQTEDLLAFQEDFESWLALLHRNKNYTRIGDICDVNIYVVIDYLDDEMKQELDELQTIFANRRAAYNNKRLQDEFFETNPEKITTFSQFYSDLKSSNKLVVEEGPTTIIDPTKYIKINDDNISNCKKMWDYWKNKNDGCL